MKLAMTDQLLKTNASLQYQYCEDGDGAFAKNVDDCVECLQHVPQSMALVNYLRALKAACEQQPKAGNGKTVKLAFDLYDLDSASASASPSVSSTSSSISSSASSSAPASSSTPTITATNAPASASASPSPLSTTTPSPSAKNTHTLRLALGISLGLILPLLLLSAFLIFFLRRRRAHRSQTPKPTLEMQHSEPTQSPPSYRNGPHPVPEMQAPVSDFVPEVDGDKPPRYR
ncbi:hypothetical protein G7Y79_00025g057610 [Physcia stellaris]|nr:hypothetical protein G7Y79_00025g057610 [Physcia stellaris]